MRERVAGIQRARLIAAMSEVACEHGTANVTAARVVSRAGVSRRTFYEIFADCKECFLAALDDAIERTANRVVPAYETPGSWRERIRAGLIALLEFLDQEPVTGRILIVESLAGGPEAVARRSQVLNLVVPLIQAGGSEKDTNQPAIAAEGVVGGVLAVIHKRILDETDASIVNLTNPLMSTIVLPYLGRSAAKRELSRPLALPPMNPEKNARAHINSLGELPMRLTYRTVRVLQYIANNPGATNRQIGQAADVTDQGQISKLLTRLQRLGLTENTEPTPGNGKRNAWTLTTTGRELERAMNTNTARRKRR